jgi:hypothetical protein
MQGIGDNQQMQNSIPTQTPSHWATQSAGFQQQQTCLGTAMINQAPTSIQNGFLPDLLKSSLGGQTPAIAYTGYIPPKLPVDYLKINREISGTGFTPS